MQVHIESKIAETESQGTIEITIDNSRRRVSYVEFREEFLWIYSLAVRFPTGSKVWPGTCTYSISHGTCSNLRPNIDKRGPVSLVGFSSDYIGKEIRSRHNAVR